MLQWPKFWKCVLNTPILLCNILNSGSIISLTSSMVCFISFIDLRVKKRKGAVSHRYSRNHVKTYGQVLFSVIFPKSRLYIGRSCRTDPAPFRFSPNTCLLKALCRCKDLNLASSYACLTNLTHLIPSDVCHQRQMGVFAALKSPPKNVATHFLIG